MNLAVADSISSQNLQNNANFESLAINSEVNLQDKKFMLKQTNQNSQKETKNESLANQNLLSELDTQTLKELEKYDRNLHNTPKTEQEKAELEKLIEAITNADYNKTKEILDNNPNLINLNLRPFYNPTSAYFYSIMKFSDKDLELKFSFQSDEYVKERKEKIQAITKGKVFDEKIFNLLMSYKPKLYTNDLLPFMVVMNESIDDNKTAEIMQIMFDDGMSANLQYFTTPKQLAEVAFDVDKFNTTELLLKYNKDERICLSLQMSSGMQVGMFFFDRDLSLFANKNEPLNDKQIALANSSEFLSLKNRQLDFVEKIIKNYCDKDLSGLVSYEMTLKRLGDNENMERLRKLGYKDRK